MKKEKPHKDYPPEEGQYFRGNDFSPVAVAIILNSDQDKIPVELDRLVRAGVENGAALSGFVQTANIGIEKMICNIVANPNIRYLILGGPESPGHRTGNAIMALIENGVSDDRRIIGSDALHPVLHNVPDNFIKRFRDQLTLIDLQFQDDPDIIKNAVRACFQENPVDFNGLKLHDIGAYHEKPLSGKLSWQVSKPWAVTRDKSELAAQKKALELMGMIREKNERKSETMN